MAKMFYTSEEAAAKLKLTADQLKAIVAENKLREFRDGARVMFKVDQVDKLVADSGKASGKSGAGLDAGSSGSGIRLSDTGHGDAISLADSDVKTRPAAAKEDTVVTATPGGSKSIFDTDEAKADASAQTQIQPAVEDQLSLEGVGSGSGLLDLTRESDDTSLGAELLDEIYPGGEQKPGGSGSSSGIFDSSAQSAAGAAPSGSGLDQVATAEAPAYTGEAIIEEARDSSSGAFGGMAFAAVGIMILTAVAVAAAYLGTSPSWLDMVTGNTSKVAIFAVILLVVSLLFAGVGFFVGKATTR